MMIQALLSEDGRQDVTVDDGDDYYSFGGVEDNHVKFFNGFDNSCMI